MKQQLIILLTLLLVFASCKRKNVSFDYSPTEPCIGATVKFTNNTEEGEEWSWNFGDGTTSTSKSPSKVYKKPGTYTVVLKVDDKKYYTYSKTITVYDSIPSIGVSDTIVYYYTPVTLSADAYNPYGYDCTYNWHLPESAVLTDGELDERTIEVYFRNHSGAERVTCDVTIGTNAFTLENDIKVEDKAASALLYIKGDSVYHQRIYLYGEEQPIPYEIKKEMMTAPRSLAATNDNLYIFNADNAQGSKLLCYNMSDGSLRTCVSNASTNDDQGFVSGTYSSGHICWSSPSAVWDCSNDAANKSWNAQESDMLVASASTLGLTAGQTVGGLIYYNGVYMWAYGKGIVRFNQSKQFTPILADRTILCMAMDRAEQKIYFVDETGLQVCNMDGSAIRMIDAEADGKAVAVHPNMDQLYWTSVAGLKKARLVHSDNNQHQCAPTVFYNTTGVCAMAIDEVER